MEDNMDQKEIFKKSEGDAFYKRNKGSLENIDFESDPLILEFKNLLQSTLFNDGTHKHILEVGCGDGTRSKFMADLIPSSFYGIDPSAIATQAAAARGIIASEGTAEKLPFQDKKFDLLIYGFCLYLCDRHDLNAIVQEASRVTKDNSWLLIMDFFSPNKVEIPYSHTNNIKSFKMDYRKIFETDEKYFCYSHKIIDHQTYKFTDTKENWTSISLMRKVKK